MMLTGLSEKEIRNLVFFQESTVSDFPTNESFPFFVSVDQQSILVRMEELITKESVSVLPISMENIVKSSLVIMEAILMDRLPNVSVQEISRDVSVNCVSASLILASI